MLSACKRVISLLSFQHSNNDRSDSRSRFRLRSLTWFVGSPSSLLPRPRLSPSPSNLNSQSGYYDWLSQQSGHPIYDNDIHCSLSTRTTQADSRLLFCQQRTPPSSPRLSRSESTRFSVNLSLPFHLSTETMVLSCYSREFHSRPSVAVLFL